MKSFFAPIAVIAALASAVSAQSFTINSLLNVVVCQPSLITWSGGVSPYFLSILPAGQPTAAALVDLGQQNGNSVTWLANLAVGTGGFLNLRDSTGAIAQSGTFTVLSGSNTTCVGLPVSTGSGPAPTGGSSATSPAASTTPSGTNTNSNTGSTTKTTGTGTAASTTAKPTNTTSGAISKHAAAGAAVMIGGALLGLAL